MAYKVDKYIFKYEPLYVARADTPPFDERFIGFGMTRNTQVVNSELCYGLYSAVQVYEMYVAGYSFQVLNNAFTSHRGFQTLKTRPAWRARQQEQNNARFVHHLKLCCMYCIVVHRFDEFAKEVSAHYGVDPYNMLQQLKKMNLKHVKVAYGKKSPTAENKKT